jgi:hypothetical protein
LRSGGPLEGPPCLCTLVHHKVEGCLTGDIAEFLGICAIVGLGAMIWLAHEYGHMLMYVFRGIVAVAMVVFAVTIYTAAFGAGATIGAHPSTWIARLIS